MQQKSKIFSSFFVQKAKLKKYAILPFFSHPYRQLLVIGINQKIAIQWDFLITYEIARAYQKSKGKYLREFQWQDMSMTVRIEFGK